MILAKEYYFNTFKIDEPYMRRLMGECLAEGGDYADLYFENSTLYKLMLRDGEVSSGGFSGDYGVGVRVLKGEKTGYAYSEDTSIKAISEAAKSAAAISSGRISDLDKIEYKNRSNRHASKERKNGKLSNQDILDILANARDSAATYTSIKENGGRKVRKFFSGKPNPAADRYAIKEDWRVVEIASMIPYLHKLEESIRSKDSRVIKVIAVIVGETSDIMMYNSFEELKYDTRPMGTVAVTAICADKGQIVNRSSSRSFRMGAEMLSDKLVEELAEETLRNLDDNFNAKRPKGGQMPVVMGPGASGILLHEAMGHAFEADFNRKGQSIFADKMGEQICPEYVTIVDDATIKGNRGALNFDDEGVPGQRTCMVENGRLESYLHDRISAKFYGVTPTGNGRRESFRSAPIPRMRNTYMENGNSVPEDIIASVKKGIYVDEFANGQVKIGEGDFTFYVKNCHLIENGKLTSPVKDINIIGNGPQALADIVAVGNDLQINDGAWTCGKGQSAPVSLGIPTVLISKLIVGGE